VDGRGGEKARWVGYAKLDSPQKKVFTGEKRKVRWVLVTKSYHHKRTQQIEDHSKDLQRKDSQKGKDPKQKKEANDPSLAHGSFKSRHKRRHLGMGPTS